MEGKLLSIIVPVYRVEDYIERCILSLEDQDISASAFEIIIINDGSPDRSRDIVLRLMTLYANIILIDQENGGVSLARNKGIDRASGRYLLFVDPDDYVQRNSLRGILDHAVRHNSQVVFLGFRLLDQGGLVKGEIVAQPQLAGAFSGVVAYNLSRGDGKTDPDRSWAILFARNFLNDNSLRFVPKIPYLEDGEFMARAMCLANCVSFDPTLVYQRTTRIGSATNSDLFFKQQSVDGFLIAVESLSAFQREATLGPNQRKFLNQPICKFSLLALMPYVSLVRFSSFRDMAKRVRGLRQGALDLQGCNNYYKIEGWLFNVSPYLFFLHRLFRAPLLRLTKP